MTDALTTYIKYFHNGDRRGIFKVITEEFKIQNAIYPGSYIHIAPSFYIPEVVYIDSFKKTKNFFEDKKIHDLIYKNKNYKEDAIIRFYLVDFYKDIEEKLDSFDLLISQYAGFVSQCCKKFLKPGGLLVANNSHGDASMASIDKSFKLVGVIDYSNKTYRFTTRNLDQYFILKKKNFNVTKEHLEKTMRGVGYIKTASAYLFEKL